MQKKWKIYTGDDICWNEYIYKSKGQYRQLFEWGEFKRKLGWNVLRVVLEENGNIRNSSQILYRKKLFLCYSWIPGGINGSLTDLNSEFLDLIKNSSNSLFIYTRADFIQLNNEKDDSFLKNSGWSKPDHVMHSGKFFILDLANDNNHFLKNAKSKWRYHFKKSQKKDLQYSEEKKTEYFIEIEKELSELRDHRNVFTEREVKPMIDELRDKLIVFIAKDLNDNLLALRSVVLVGDTAWHLSSSVNTKGRDSLSGYGLLMHTIDICRQRGIKYYNLGGIYIERFPGPYRFKLGIARKENSVETLGEWEYSSPFFLKGFFNFAIKLYINSSYFLSRFFKNL